MLKDIFETTPEAINKKGTCFWLDNFSTNYAKEIDLKDVKVFFLKDKSGYKTRVIVEKGEYVFENQKLEDICVHLDIMKAIKEI